MSDIKKHIMWFVTQIPSFLLITFGASMAAAALEIFLIPNLIIDGGLNGISIILTKVLGGSLSMYILVLNIPFLLIAWKQLGKKFLVKTIYGMLIFSLLLEVFSTTPEVTDDILLALVYGGLLLGVGVGLVIKEGGCLDGTEALAIFLSKRIDLSVGQIVFIFNIFIYGSAILVFGVDRALYSLLTYFITFKIIDTVSEGLQQAKAAIIITDKEEEISNEIFKKLGRTVTIISGRGMASGSQKVILYTVITRLEIQELKDIIRKADVSSFVTISDVSDIIGSHVKQLPDIKESI